MKPVNADNTRELVEKLRSSAKYDLNYLNQKDTGLLRIPGYVRLKQVAASVLEYQLAQIRSLTAERDAAVYELRRLADCSTCKNGPEAKCACKAECGNSHSLYQWKALLPPENGNSAG